jgi:hypothetical protein
MKFSINGFEKWATWFYGFCRRMEKGGLPNMPKDDRDCLLSVNLHMQIALEAMKSQSERSETL